MKHSGHGKSSRYNSRHRIYVRRRIFVGLLAALLVLLLACGIFYVVKGHNSDSNSQTPASSAVSDTSSASIPESTPTSSSEEPDTQTAAQPAATEEPAFVPTWNTAGMEGFPYLVAINRTTQTVTVYEKDAEGNYTVPHSSMICSTGDATPLGEFYTTDQYTWRLLEGNVYGQYATRITGSILFHSVPYFKQDKATLESEEFNKLGTPASLGCIRLQIKDCKWIYDECPSGTRVILYEGDESTDPLGNPGFEPIDLTNPNANWDPTDPDPKNPWLAA